MTTDAELVAAKAVAMFSATSESVLDLLSEYEPPSSMSADRIRLAILKLVDGDESKLLEMIELAEIDPRDVVGEAEYPRQMRHPPGMATEEMILADRADYEAWLSSE